MGRVVLDSSVLIALLDSTDSHHGAVREKFQGSEDQFEISVLTFTEAMTAPMMANPRSGERIRQAISTAIASVHSVTEEIAVKGAHVRVATGLKTVDTLISATATVGGAKLWTCDQKLAKAHKGAVLIA